MAITPPLSLKAQAAARQAVDGVVLAKLTPDAPPAAAPDLGTAAPLFSTTEEPKPRTAGHVLAEILGQQIAFKRAEFLIQHSTLSEADKDLRDQIYSETSSLDERHAKLVAELGTLLATSNNEHDIATGASVARQLADKAKELVAASPDGNLKDIYKSLVNASGFPPQPEKNRLALTPSLEEDIDEYEKQLQERTKTLAQMREYMKSAEGGTSTFSGMLSGLAPALQGPPAQVPVNSVATAVTRFMEKRGHSPEQAFAMALVCEEGCKTNIALQGVTALFYGGQAIPQSIMAAINAGTKIDVLSADWQKFKDSLGAAGESLTGDVSQIMSKAYTEVSIAQRDQQCMQLWRVLADPDGAGKQHLSMKTPLTAAQMEKMPASLRARFGDTPTMGDMMAIVQEGGFAKYATALTGAYAHAKAQDGMTPFSRNEIEDTVRGALGMPPDGSTIIASMDQYVSGGGSPAKPFDHGQHNPNIKMSVFGFSRDINDSLSKPTIIPSSPPVHRQGSNEPFWQGNNKGVDRFLG